MSKQLPINLFLGQHGGRRPKCGRKRLKSKGVSHRSREQVTGRDLLHINFKYKTYVRSDAFYEVFKRGIKNSARFDFKILSFSIESNHIHLIAEAGNSDNLTLGMKSLTCTLSKGLNLIKNTNGKTQIERFHLHILKNPQEARNAINYVLFNHEKHTGTQKISKFCSLYGMIELPEGRSWLYRKCKLDLLHL